MRLRYFLLFLFVATLSNAQVSGYMGKRFVIGYSNYFMLGLRGPGPNNSGPMDESSFTINNAHCLNLEFAHKQRKMICLSAQFIRTGIAYDRGGHDNFINGASYREYPYPEGVRYGGSYSKPALLTSKNISLGIKYFKSGLIAPVGRYRKLEILMLFETIKYDYRNFYKQVDSEPVNDTLYTLGKGEYKYKNIAIVYTIGKQRILKDKFVLDYGIRFAWSPALNIVTLTGGIDDSPNIETYYRRQSNLRIAKEQIVNIHIGIGFLAF